MKPRARKNEFEENGHTLEDGDSKWNHSGSDSEGRDAVIFEQATSLKEKGFASRLSVNSAFLEAVDYLMYLLRLSSLLYDGIVAR